MHVAKSWEVVQHVDAPIDTVWELLADGRGWKTWARFARSELVAEGIPAPDGVGARRAFGSGPFGSVEEVVVFDPPQHFAYELRSGMPIVGYRADVHLTTDTTDTADTRGTTITWKSAFEKSKVPGGDGFYAWFLRFFVRDTAKRLAAAAERRAASSP